MRAFLRVVMVVVLFVGLGGCGVLGSSRVDGCRDVPEPLLSRLKDVSKRNFTNEGGDLISHFEYVGSAMVEMAPQVRRDGLSRYVVLWGHFHYGGDESTFASVQGKLLFVSDDAGDRLYVMDSFTRWAAKVDVRPKGLQPWFDFLFKHQLGAFLKRVPEGKY